MTTVACVILMDIDEPDYLGHQAIDGSSAVAVRDAVAEAMPACAHVLAIMTPGECTHMLHAHIRTLEAFGMEPTMLPLTHRHRH